MCKLESSDMKEIKIRRNCSTRIVFFAFVIQLAASLDFSASFDNKYQCHVTKCDLKLTPEHGTQISMIQELGSTEAGCLRRLERVNVEEYLGLYCPDELFCGLDLQPENTKDLMFLANKSCSVFAKTADKCASFASILRNSDVNECREKAEPCNVGGVCFNKINQGSDCSCYPGFSRTANWEKGIVDCQDIDECSEEIAPCPGENRVCQNNIGSYTCGCKAGYRPKVVSNKEKIDCEDIDECEEFCDFIAEKCENTDGSFTCGCISGYERDTKNTSCIETGYATEGRKAVKLCENGCECNSPYMVGNYNGTNYCMNTFFLLNGNNSVYPQCQAPCCNTTCNWVQPTEGSCSGGVFEDAFERNLWDRSPLNFYKNGTCFHSQTDSDVTVELSLESLHLVNSVSILNRYDG